MADKTPEQKERDKRLVDSNLDFFFELFSEEVEEWIQQHFPHEGNVLTVLNRHVEDCGKPPELITDKNYTVAYFENDAGEQLVFRYDREKQIGMLWHGDYHWEHPMRVLNGKPVGILLDSDEQKWLDIVWAVATRRY